MTKYHKIAYLFPGQGAQYVGMAKDIGETFPIAAQTFEEADDLLGRKLSKIIFYGSENELTKTKNSQVAIYVVSVALLRTLHSLLPHISPQVCSGLSLGEYTALHASGRISFAECLKLVQWRGQYMNDACEATQGAMAVILGLESDQVADIVRDLQLPNDLWVANFNCPGQVVISGTLKGLDAGMAAAKERGAKRALLLQVHGAFHSGLMQSAEESLAEHVLSAPFAESDVGLVMNVSGNFVSDLQDIRSHLINQVTHSVYWEKGIQNISSSGADLFLEIGPKKTLTEFNKRIKLDRPVPTFSIEKLGDLQMIERELV